MLVCLCVFVWLNDELQSVRDSGWLRGSLPNASDESRYGPRVESTTQQAALVAGEFSTGALRGRAGVTQCVAVARAAAAAAAAAAARRTESVGTRAAAASADCCRLASAANAQIAFSKPASQPASQRRIKEENE